MTGGESPWSNMAGGPPLVAKGLKGGKGPKKERTGAAARVARETRPGGGPKNQGTPCQGGGVTKEGTVGMRAQGWKEMVAALRNWNVSPATDAAVILCTLISMMSAGTSGSLRPAATTPSSAWESVAFPWLTTWTPPATPWCRLWSTLWTERCPERAASPPPSAPSPCSTWTLKTESCWRITRTWWWRAAAAGSGLRTP